MSELATFNSHVMLSGEEAAIQLVRMCDTPEKIEELEYQMTALPQIEVPVTHRVVDGVYAREITLPAGHIAIGHAHKNDCINVMLTGRVSVMIEGEINELVAPRIFIGKAMDRKVGFVHEASTWLTFHQTAISDPAVIEEQIIVKSETFKQYERNKQTLISAKNCIIPGLIGRTESTDAIERDQHDFKTAISDLGFSEEQVWVMSDNLLDQVGVDDSANSDIFLSKSFRHGVGVFARKDINVGDVIAPARIGKLRTTAGRYINHSVTPNARMDVAGDIVNAVALNLISEREEITVDYRKSGDPKITNQVLQPCHQSH